MFEQVKTIIIMNLFIKFILLILAIPFLEPVVEWLLDKSPIMGIMFIVGSLIIWGGIWFNRKFMTIDVKFQRFDDKFKEVDARLDKHEVKIENLNKHVVEIDKRLCVVEVKVDNLTKDVEAIDKKIDKMDHEIKQQFEKVDEKLEKMDQKFKEQLEKMELKFEKRFEKIDEEFDAQTKLNMEMLSMLHAINRAVGGASTTKQPILN
jgi:chromosome segregation ATPase